MPPGLLASQHPGCYTPKSSGMGAILHNQAGDLHSPSLYLTANPSSRIHAVPNTQPGRNQFGMQYTAPHDVQTIPGVQQPTYAPTEFTYQNWDHGILDKFETYPTFDNLSIDSALAALDPTINLAAPTEDSPPEAIPNELPHSQGERLRYHVALRTRTSMVKSRDEDPISYLNKGQVYGLMVMDLNPPAMTPEVLRYRTFVRVSFDDEEQRSNPALCWKLWKESRGTTEAQQRGSDLLAIEFAAEDKDQRHMQLEQVCIDGFCVTWTAERGESTKRCQIPLRFNFLSTDFSHSKGVKGVPIRLCAKTELLSLESVDEPCESEMCYCKVKLFRDHGAERKINNDIQHVQKSIARLEQQIKDVPLGGRCNKRRRANNTSTDMKDSDGLDHGRIGSSFGECSIEDDLRRKLAVSQSMLSSIRTISVLALRGEKGDDPDKYPIHLTKNQKSAEDVRGTSIEGQSLDLPSQLTAKQPSKPTACFFIRANNEPNDVFRAIYLPERTAEELKKKICEKYHIDQSKIEHLLRIVNDDLKIIIDDDLVGQLPVGQTMIVDICETTSVVDGGSCLKEIRLKY
ncbi:hypothetical protein N7481_002422 [Penicillium waksmanii]|uniref:uncharacterized protein n=1 Tax=Penicillium waksmanii TaxID=69791 RepID=UPI0025492B4C|nr:uncharacterized protein N7481_002422 [Penicillium waksmanii]KAJ5995445.1 hypothetical protein N7481_002422 [Penicillium waksmanii]